MGIYSNGKIFGIKIYNFNDDDKDDKDVKDDDSINILYERSYDEEMTSQQMRDAYLFYNNLNNKNKVCFKMYIECGSILINYGHAFMMWYPLSLNTFLEKFGV